jgi:hypothetical protein
MECHKCPHFGKFEGQPWRETPCAKCFLRQSAGRTREYNEDMLDEKTADLESSRPYEGLTGRDDDPLIPLSVLCKAMACWVSLTLPAREIFKLRMCNMPTTEISKILGYSKQALNGHLDRAIKANPVMVALIDKGNNLKRKPKGRVNK